MMKQLILTLLMVFWMAVMLGIEVSGHIAENTTWTPDNNPYIITSFLYIDAGATLTIEPGTDIRVHGADKSNIYNFYWYDDTPPLAKMIIVYGKIVAIGTELMPITFDVYSEESDFRWGGIYMDDRSSVSSFIYCVFSRSFICFPYPNRLSMAALHFFNGVMNVRNCTFYNNYAAIRTMNLRADIVIYDCKFYSNDELYPTPYGHSHYIAIGVSEQYNPEQYFECIIAKCYFDESPAYSGGGYHTNVLFLNNIFDDTDSENISDDETREPWTDFGNYSAYGNLLLLNESGSIGCTSQRSTDIAFARRNKLIKLNQNDPIRIGGSGLGINHISDNHLYGSMLIHSNPAHAPTTYIYNNVLETTNVWAFDIRATALNQDGELRIFNNLVRSINPDSLYWTRAFQVFDAHPMIFNNTIVGFSSTIECNYTLEGGAFFDNNIFSDLDFAPSNGPGPEHPVTYGNNCFSIPFGTTSYIIDAGGNIAADPMFADTLNADYSLSAGSPCIDAGAYRPDLPDFDIRYHKRIAPGVPNGQPLVDIGAYENNSVYIGGLRGYVFNPDSGEMIDCVKVQIGHKLPEFSDSLGCFEYPTGPGVYTVRASRWDYDDQIIENVVVTEGELALIAIPMYLSTTSADDPSVSPNLTSSLRNYPNPFNPSTTISFIAPETGDLNLAVYNLKGQRVKTLHKGQISKGQHNILWNGLDERGAAVGSGIYIVRLELNGLRQSHRMMLIK